MSSSSSDAVAAPASTSDDNDDVWKALVAWVQQGGGYIHPHLHLRCCNDDEADRGVYAQQNGMIEKGALLIRIPENLALHGQSLPAQYQQQQFQQKYASPWLRCIAAYLQASQAKDRAPYMASLPDTYETLWQWSNEEIDTLLAGTSPSASETSWKIDQAALQQRYREQIRPYLIHCNIVTADSEKQEQEFALFATACQALSTRGFHMQQPAASSTIGNIATNSTPSDSYSGPFLLPIMDLLNHAAASGITARTCTTLERHGNDFVMVAERDIAANEELLHSYGDQLCSSQFLASFGFVPEDAIERAAGLSTPTTQQQQSVQNNTPAILSKANDVWAACWNVIESELPQRLAASMREQDMEDEVWAVIVDKSRTAEYVPEDILISASSASSNTIDSAHNGCIQQLHLLTDELVTAACVPFLPRCAYSEITTRTLLDRSILEDFYLGTLVGTALLKAIQKKLETYTAIPDTVVQQLLPALARSYEREREKDEKEPPIDDSTLLRELVCRQKDDTEMQERLLLRRQRQRLAYALTVRIEEKETLLGLRGQVLALLAALDAESNNEEVDGDSASKRFRAL